MNARPFFRGRPSVSADRETDPTAGLPPDLAALLRDPSIIVPQDAAVFERIAKWMDAPSNTASALTVDEWRDAWVYSTNRFRKAEDALAQLRAERDTLREALLELREAARKLERARREQRQWAHLQVHLNHLAINAGPELGASPTTSGASAEGNDAEAGPALASVPDEEQQA